MATRSVTDCDGVNIVVSLTDEISDAITNWAEVAEQYESKTEMTLEILGQYFLTRNQFLSYDTEIKYFISKGLSERDRQKLNESAVFLNERNKSNEKKLLADARTLIKKKILKIFNRLLLELFPSFLPPRLEQPKTKKPKERTTNDEKPDDDTIPSPSNENEETPTDQDDEDLTDEELVSNLNLRNLTISEPRVNLNTQFNRARYGNATASLPQDLFETPENALMLLEPTLNDMQGKVIYEPCCGNGAIVRFLEQRSFTVISRDLYATEEKHDYLLSEDPEYDVLITNPPFCLKHKFFEKAMHSGKPFIMLLPLQFLTPKCSYDNIKRCEIDIMIMNPSPVFLNGDVERSVGDCGKIIFTAFKFNRCANIAQTITNKNPAFITVAGWFFVNTGTGGGHFTVQRLPNI